MFYTSPCILSLGTFHETRKLLRNSLKKPESLKGKVMLILSDAVFSSHWKPLTQITPSFAVAQCRAMWCISILGKKLMSLCVCVCVQACTHTGSFPGGPVPPIDNRPCGGPVQEKIARAAFCSQSSPVCVYVCVCVWSHKQWQGVAIDRDHDSERLPLLTTVAYSMPRGSLLEGWLGWQVQGFLFAPLTHTIYSYTHTIYCEHTVGHSHLGPRPMDHPEVKWLQCQIPPGDPVVDIFHAVEPLEGSVVRAEGE